MHKYNLIFNDNKIDDIFKDYKKDLSEKLGTKNESKGPQTQAPRLQPVWREPNYQQPPYNPHPLQVPNRR